MDTLTPIPKVESKPMTMDFPDAIKKVIGGKMIARISWGNKDYCLLKDGWLTIFTKEDFFTWTVSESDMKGQDWIIVTEAN